MAISEGIVMFISESGAVIVLSILSFMFTPSYGANVTITQIVNSMILYNSWMMKSYLLDFTS